MWRRFIGGTNILAAVNASKKIPFHPIYDYAKESAKSKDEALNYAQRVQRDVRNIDSGMFALKYSSFNEAPLMQHTIENMLPYVDHVLLDAEDDSLHETERQVYRDLIKTFNMQDVRIYKTYQMYRKNAFRELVEDIQSHEHLGIKLVRGAYLKKDAHVVWESKEKTDKAYNHAVKHVIHQMKNKPSIRLMIATHNFESIDLAVAMNPDKNKTTFAQLLGMKDGYGLFTLKKGYKTYKYIPYGSFFETYPYLLRRIYENIGMVTHMVSSSRHFSNNSRMICKSFSESSKDSKHHSDRSSSY